MDDPSFNQRLQPVLEKLTDADKRILEHALKHIEEQEKKNTRFWQLSQSHIFHIRKLAKSAPAAHQLLMTMVENMNRTNSLVATQKVLASYSGYSVATIKTAIKYLAEHNWIELFKIGNIHGYRVNSRIVWGTTPHGRNAAFNATILLSEEDQRELARTYSHPLKHVPVLDRPHTEQTLIQNDLDTNQKELDV